MAKVRLNDFYNDGFGWICIHCEKESEPGGSRSARSRLFTEGEAEAKQPELSGVAMAKWADLEHRTLICPRCGITELADKH